MADKIVSIDVGDVDTADLDVDRQNISAELSGGTQGQIKMIGPMDNIIMADPDQVTAYEEQGWRVESIQDTMDRAFGEGREQEFGDLGSQIEAGGRAALKGASFGLSDVVLGDEYGKIISEVNPVTSIIGEVGGAILPTLLSGGTGLPGTITRLSPRGALAAASAKYVSSASTTGARALRGLTTGVVEGAMETAGSYIANQAISDNPQESGSSIANQFLMNTFLGGVGGGLGGLATKADEALIALKPIPEEDIQKFKSLLNTTTDTNRRSVSAASKKITKSTTDLDLDEIASPSMIHRSRQTYSRLQDRIATAAARNVDQEINDLLSNPFLKNALADEEYLRLTSKLRGLAGEYNQASQSSKLLAESHGSIVGNAKNAKEFGAALKNVSNDLDSRFSDSLAKLDESSIDLDSELTVLRNALAGVDAIDAQTKAAASFDPNILDRIRSSISSSANAIKSNPIISKTIDVADDIAGAAEIANQLGVDVPSLSQLAGGRDSVVGQAIGLYLSAKTGMSALGKTGTKFGINPLNRAAATANAAKNKFVQILESGLKKATTVINKKRSIAAPLMSTGLVQAANNVNKENIRAQAVAEASLLPNDVAFEVLGQVDRTLNYIEQHKPKNPNQGTPWQTEWRADPVAENEFGRRTRAALDPLYAIDRIFSTPNNTLEIEALKRVHPLLFSETQSRLMQMTDAERSQLSEPMKQSLGRGFGVPLQINQLPGYGLTTINPHIGQPQPQFGQPSVSRYTSFVRSEDTGPRRR